MSGTANITGGTLNVGTAATTGNAGNFDFRIRGQVPALVVDNTTNAKNVLLIGADEHLRQRHDQYRLFRQHGIQRLARPRHCWSPTTALSPCRPTSQALLLLRRLGPADLYGQRHNDDRHGSRLG